MAEESGSGKSELAALWYFDGPLNPGETSALTI